MKGLFFVLFCLIVAGCGSSSPRFVSREATKGSEQHEKKNTGPRFTSKHVEEEIKEDDRKVDVNQVVVRFSSARPAPSKSPETSPTVRNAPPERSSTGTPGKIDDQKMMDVILSYLGTPYVWGGDSKSGIDCSAFTNAVYDQSINVQLPRTTADQVKLGKPISRDELKFGDLMFFNTTGTNPSHVGIYIGDDLFAHASEAFGVTISSIESSYYKKRYTEARRIVE
ncbi:MAG TPA: C40 family peptidase [Bacteroidota bacterium]|nr:C40 family peptidase [Bacteroidota bacterium]